MAFPNLSDIATTTIESRSKQLADNVTKNNALLARLNKKGKVKPVDGGTVILQELSFAENGNFGWYSGYDQLPVAASDVISAAQFPWKQAAAAVTISGLDQIQNSGRARMLDLLESRIGVAEATMANNITGGLYSDGTGAGGKQLTGLAAAVPADPTTGVYGAIDRSAWSFWRSKVQAAAGYTSANIQTLMNQLWVQLVRGMDRPDIILMDNLMYATFLASLQSQQRFTTVASAELGFSTIKFMDADVVLDGGIGGFCPANSAYFLNTDYLFYRPHAERNMVPLSPDRRAPVNQDATVALIGFAGNATCSNASLQGYLKGF